MSNEFVDELSALAERLRESAKIGESPDIADPMDRLMDAADAVGQAWSGSPLGYHAHVYYADLQAPPAGAHWSSEWGEYDALSGGSRGDWREYRPDAVIAQIQERAHEPDLEAARAASAAARAQFEDVRGEVVSILTAYLSERPDELIGRLRGDAENVLVATADQFVRATFPSGQVMSRDSLAMTQGFLPAPHISIQADVFALKAPFRGCSALAQIASRASVHMRRVAAARWATADAQGGAVFIGHGQSLLWRELKDFIQERLSLPWEEFNRVPVAGVTNIARLAQMLDASGVAFLVLTAEDELIDGGTTARQNVVHEAGLFQGRLGFTRAIVLLEEGCAEFSNIQGLGQIRFPKGNVAAAFEEVRRVLEREGFCEP